MSVTEKKGSTMLVMSHIVRRTALLALLATPLLAQDAGVQTKQSQSVMTPVRALQMLQEGNERFLAGAPLKRDLPAQVAATAKGQYPYAVILSCIDSRVAPEIVLDQGLGDVFDIRIAGNVVNPDILGSMEFATAVAGAKAIVVIGHTSCGAVKGARDSVKFGNLTQLLAKIGPAMSEVDAARDTPAPVDLITERHVRKVMDEIRADSPIIRDLEKKDAIAIVGGMHDLTTGRVRFFK
jgi:carbonic anhydrase